MLQYVFNALDLNLRILIPDFPAREESQSHAITAEMRFHDLDAVHEGNMDLDSIEWSPSLSGTTVFSQGSSVLASQPCSSILPDPMNQPPMTFDQTPPLGPFVLSVPHHPGLPLPLQSRLSSSLTPASSRGLALPNSPSHLRRWSPMQSSDSFLLTPPRNSPFNEKVLDPVPPPGRSSLPVPTVLPLNQLDVEASQSVDTQPSEPVASNTALNAVPPFLNQPLMVEPLTKEKREKRSGRKQSVPLVESPPKVASPSRPKTHPKPQMATCAPSARKRQSGECLSEDRGDISGETKHQKTSPT